MPECAGNARRFRVWSAFALLAGGCPLAAQPVGEPVGLSLEAARGQLESVSPALAGAAHGVAAARETAQALQALRRPVVTASAQVLEYQKTLSLDIAARKQAGLDGLQDFLSGVPGGFPPEYQAIAAEVTGRISQALPGLFEAVPDTLSYRYRETLFRPTVQAALPLYTGGAIPAVQKGAAAGVAIAEARASQVREVQQLNLIRAYFGQLAAQSLEQSARQSRDALDRLLADVRRMEAEGLVPHARTLEAEVARDTAERAYQRALLAHDSARTELAELLQSGPVRPTTPLFVDTRPLAPAEAFLGGEAETGQARQADAAGKAADAGVALARARMLPQAFAFGEYNLNRDNALPTEPDWVVGVGVRYTLLSNIDRRHAVAAAREQAAAAGEAGKEARRLARSGTLRGWDLVESARRSFLLLDSSLAAATENLRVQTLSFREGEGTLTAVLAAEAALGAARTQRIATAYEYDLALAALLLAAGRLDSFDDHMGRADVRLKPEPVQ